MMETDDFDKAFDERVKKMNAMFQVPPGTEAYSTMPPSSNSAARKSTPVYSGCMAYFPLALSAIARLSKKGNDKHNAGEPLHWSRHKSCDHLDCIARHLLEAGVIDPDDGEYHDVKIAWRALANLEILEEKRLGLTKQETK